VKRIGILGGSFNPVHLGHLLAAQHALEAGRLERVWFLPSNIPPHKEAAPLAPPADRLEMVRLAIAGNPDFGLCDDEIVRGGVSYAVDTMRRLRVRAPEAQPVFIIGMDSLPELHLWRDVGTLLTLCEFLVLERPGCRRPREAAELRLPPPWGERLLAAIRPGRLCDISSTEIRRRVAGGRSIRYLVPASVASHIAARGLYREAG
jgi:nicotinate-nucleotide adenylyltransferase